MLIEHNHLRECRKNSCLTQTDIAFILGYSHPVNVCRYEQSNRKPNIEVLIGYHLLFNSPIETFFERHKIQLVDVITTRIKELVQKLQTETNEPEVDRRICYLSEALTRLMEYAKKV